MRWEDALSRVLSESPELAAAAAEVQAARWATRRARVEWIPNVGIQATLQHDNASRDDVAGVQVALPLPLFNRNQGNIVATDAQLVAAQRNLERVRLSLQNRLAEVFRRYVSAGQQVEKYRGTILPDAKETLDLVASGYQQGEFSYLHLLTGQRTYFESNLAYLESLSQLKSAHAQIEGLLLNESLDGSSGQRGRP
jgi:outer membrane protein TolC